MKQKFLTTAILASSMICFGNPAQAITITSTYTYDAISRLTHIVYQTGFDVAYAYDPAGNITNVTSQSPPPPPTLTDAVLSLQVMAGQNPAGISTADDINQDGRIGLPEAIDVLKKLSQ